MVYSRDCERTFCQTTQTIKLVHRPGLRERGRCSGQTGGLRGNLNKKTPKLPRRVQHLETEVLLLRGEKPVRIPGGPSAQEQVSRQPLAGFLEGVFYQGSVRVETGSIRLHLGRTAFGFRGSTWVSGS